MIVWSAEMLARSKLKIPTVNKIVFIFFFTNVLSKLVSQTDWNLLSIDAYKAGNYYQITLFQNHEILKFTFFLICYHNFDFQEKPIQTKVLKAKLGHIKEIIHAFVGDKF
jgi:hypothetical protein